MNTQKTKRGGQNVRASYSAPEMEIVNVALHGMLCGSYNYGVAGGDPTEDDVTILD